MYHMHDTYDPVTIQKTEKETASKVTVLHTFLPKQKLNITEMRWSLFFPSKLIIHPPFSAELAVLCAENKIKTQRSSANRVNT